MALQMAMTLAGTFPALGYLFLKKIYGENIRTRYYVYLLRLSVLFFLCPFQYFKFQFLPIAWTEIFDIQLYWDVLMKKLFGYSFVSIPSGDGYYYIISEKYFYLWILWFVIVAVALLIYLFWYLYMKRKIMRHSVEREVSTREAGGQADAEREVLASGAPAQGRKNREKRHLWRRRTVKIYENDRVSGPCTIGWLRPGILLPDREYKESEMEWIRLHEMTHIRHRDIFWKLLCILVCILHWYNPFAWYLLCQYGKMSEYYCDEKCMEDRSMKEKKGYAMFLVREAVDKKAGAPVNYLSEKGKKMKERIRFILCGEKKKGTAVLAVGVLSFCLSGLSVFAYMPPYGDLDPMEENGYYLNEFEMKEMELDTDLAYDFSQSDILYFDEDGNPVSGVEEGNVQPYAKCSHSRTEKYKKVKHIRLDNGGCKVKEIELTKCKNCGAIVKKEVLSVTKRKKCPH